MDRFLLKAALELAFLKLKVLPLHSVDANGLCSCGSERPLAGAVASIPASATGNT